VRWGLAALALLCAACSPPAPPEPSEPAPVAEPAPALSPDGYGALRIGMTPEEAAAALGHALLLNVEPMNDCAGYVFDPNAEFGPRGEPEGMRFLAIGGRLARIDDYGSEGVATPEGIAVGATEAAVRAAYPNAVEEPGEHDPPTTTLTAWTVPNERGYRFYMFDGRVSAIAVGTDAIQLTEGCS
jgi:hypothetical protein